MKSLLALTLPMVLLIGCSGAETTQSDASSKTSPSETAAPIEVTTVSWEDLMPEGEDERLETLYTEFYSNLEQQYKNDQTTLMGISASPARMALTLARSGLNLSRAASLAARSFRSVCVGSKTFVANVSVCLLYTSPSPRD